MEQHPFEIDTIMLEISWFLDFPVNLCLLSKHTNDNFTSVNLLYEIYMKRYPKCKQLEKIARCSCNNNINICESLDNDILFNKSFLTEIFNNNNIEMAKILIHRNKFNFKLTINDSDTIGLCMVCCIKNKNVGMLGILEKLVNNRKFILLLDKYLGGMITDFRDSKMIEFFMSRIGRPDELHKLIKHCIRTQDFELFNILLKFHYPRDEIRNFISYIFEREYTSFIVCILRDESVRSGIPKKNFNVFKSVYKDYKRYLMVT